MEMEEEPFEINVRFAPEAATYAAERRWSRDQRCEMHDDGSVTLPIRAHNESACLSWVLGFADRAQVLAPDWLRREIKKTVYAMARLYHTPHKPADTAESGGSPAAACPCGCGSNPRCRTCVHPYRMFLYQVLRLGPPRSHPRRFQSVRTLPLPQRLKGSWDTHAPPCRDSPFLSRVMGKKYFAASEGYGIESIGNENEFLFHNKGRTA